MKASILRFGVAGDVRVIRVSRWEEYLRCEELQKAICSGEYPPTRAAFLRPANEHGGLLLMALLGSEPVGLAFGHPALQGRVLHHHSYFMGVLEEHRHEGIGFLLKSRQREEVLAQGLAMITWTLDPLRSDHANLSFRKLGAHSKAYLRDYLGPRGISPEGTSGDRLWVEWQLDDRGVITHLQAGSLVAWEHREADTINATAPLAGGFREPGGVDLRLNASPLFLEIPWDLRALGLKHPEVATAWEKEVRQALEHYLVRDYRIVDLTVDRRYRRSFHVLTGV